MRRQISPRKQGHEVAVTRPQFAGTGRLEVNLGVVPSRDLVHWRFSSFSLFIEIYRGDSTQLDQHFADVLALEETDEGTHRLLDTLDEGFLVFDLASPKVAPYFPFKLCLAVQ
jgi:hypothetical protein